MSTNDRVFTGSIPAIYDKYLVPLLFETFAADLADRISNLRPKTVLEIAAGSGVVTRALAPRLSPEATYTVTDLNEPMLEHAAEMQGPDDRLTWHQADAQELPFDDNSFDAVLCQFGVMFFPERNTAYSEVRRVLKPDGSFIFNTWDDLESNEIPNIVEETLITMFPEDPPRFISRTPYGYYDKHLIRNELISAGFSQPAMVTMDDSSTVPSARHAATAICLGTPLRNEIEARDPAILDHAVDQVTEAIAARYGDGPITGKMRGFVISASK